MSHLIDITGLFNVRLFALRCLWSHFITTNVICQQPLTYLCQYIHNFWPFLYLKGYRQQLVYWQEDVVCHRQCSGVNHTNAEQLYYSGYLPVPMGMACWWGLENTEEGKIPLPTPVATPPTLPFLWGIFPSNPWLWCFYLHMHGSSSPPTSEMSAVLAKGCIVFSETTSWAWVSTWKHHLLYLLLHQVTDIRTHYRVTGFASMCRKIAHRGKPWTWSTWKNCTFRC